MSFPRTLGELRHSPFSEPRLHTRRVKDELRDNLAAKLRSGGPIFSGIVGYDDTVVPQIINAVLSRHNFILLGLRGQAKSRILRALATLLDPETPYIAGCEIHDNPYSPICRRCREEVAKHGDDTPIAYLTPEQRYVEKLSTPDVTIADLIGDIDPIKAARRGQDVIDAFFDLALEDDLQTQFTVAIMNTDAASVAEIFTHPRSLIGLSDAGAHLTLFCEAGQTSRLLGHWVRERGALTLEDAVRRVTSMPAELFGLRDRGRLQAGLAALVAFDPPPAPLRLSPATLAADGLLARTRADRRKAHDPPRSPPAALSPHHRPAPKAEGDRADGAEAEGDLPWPVAGPQRAAVDERVEDCDAGAEHADRREPPGDRAAGQAERRRWQRRRPGEQRAGGRPLSCVWLVRDSAGAHGPANPRRGSGYRHGSGPGPGCRKAQRRHGVGTQGWIVCLPW